MATPSRAVLVAAILAATVLGVVLLVGSLGVPVPMLRIDVEMTPAPRRPRTVTRFGTAPTPPSTPVEPPAPPLSDPTEPLLLGRGPQMGMNARVGYRFGDRIPTTPRRPGPASNEQTESGLTPLTVRPVLTNADEVSRLVMQEYPAELRDVGIGGAPVVWVHVGRTGAVDATLIFQTSGYEALDQAALDVARAMVFTPAQNGERAVTTWIELPIRFRIAN
jgi:protein TonB